MDVQQLIEQAPRTGARPAVAVVVAFAIAVCVGGLAFAAGIRWFVVDTPSMGTTAPVGSLVVTEPVPSGATVGEIIAFEAPGVRRVYTHRVVAVEPDGAVHTRGDINGAADPWTVPRSAVVGHAVAILPGVGHVLRALPLVLVGAVAVFALTMLIRRRDLRFAARVIGLHGVVAAVLLVLHPLVSVVLLATVTDGTTGEARASVVSTGVLPIRLVDSSGGVVAHLTDGSPQVVTMPPTVHGMSRLNAMPDSGPALQVVLLGLAALPALVVFAIGIPGRAEEDG